MELDACLDAPARAAQAGAIREVGARLLEPVRRLRVELERLDEARLEVVRDEPLCAGRARERPREPLRARRLERLGCDPLRLAPMSEADMRVDELRRGGHVDVADAQLPCAGALRLELLDRRLGPAEPELELAERGVRPQLVEADAELDAELARFQRVRVALLLLALAALEPGEPG